MGSGVAGKETCELVRKALPVIGIGLTYNEVHQRVGVWSVGTIRHALRHLREEGLAVRIGPKQNPRFLRLENNGG